MASSQWAKREFPVSIAWPVWVLKVLQYNRDARPIWPLNKTRMIATDRVKGNLCLLSNFSSWRRSYLTLTPTRSGSSRSTYPYNTQEAHTHTIHNNTTTHALQCWVRTQASPKPAIRPAIADATRCLPQPRLAPGRFKCNRTNRIRAQGVIFTAWDF